MVVLTYFFVNNVPNVLYRCRLNNKASQVEDTKIEPSVFSDHNMISLKLNIETTSTNCNPNDWKLNNTRLSDRIFREDAIKTINENRMKAREENLFGKHWDYTK